MEFVGRGDLVQRALGVELQDISKGRKLKGRIFQQFDEALPGILGGLFNAASIALRRFSQAKDAAEASQNGMRLLDAEAWITSGEQALGFEVGSFRKAHTRMLANSSDDALDGDIYALAVVKVFRAQAGESSHAWEGPVSKFLELVQNHLDWSPKDKKSVISTPQAFSSHLRRIGPILESSAGIRVEALPRKKDSRNYRLSCVEK